MTARCDAVIVGGGAVGSALALDLLARGLDPLLLEARAPDYTPSTPEREIALSAGSVGYLQQLKVWPQVAQSGVGRIRHIRVMEARGSASVALDGDHDDLLGCVVEMGQLLRALHAALGARLIAPATLGDWRCDGDAVRLSYRMEGKEETVQTRLLVAADGSDSQLRRKAGIATWGWDHNRFGVVASVTTEAGHRDTAYECFRAQGPLALLPMADGRFSMVWAEAPRQVAEWMQCDATAFTEKLSAALNPAIRAQTGAITALSARALFPLEFAIARSFHAPRFALVGNAAHTIHPVAGQGMNLGLRDAQALAQAVHDHRRFGDPGHPMVLAQYGDSRKGDVAMTAGFTEGLLTTFAAPGRLPRLARQIGMRGMGRGLRRLLIDYASGRAQARP